MISITTWNVLHRIHAVNWGDAANVMADERARIAAIAARVAAAPADEIWCLQEVSGDQLAALRDVLADARVFELTYPRVPRLRRAGTAVTLADPNEHLAVIVRAGSPWHAGARVVHAEAFASDPGKGLLAVDLGGDLTVIATHVSYGDKHRDQCGLLAALARRAAGVVAIAGDFNCDRAAVHAAFGAGFAAADHEDRVTRPRTASSKSQAIDHVIAWRGVPAAAHVEDATGLSDHHIVRADVTTSTS